MEERGVGVDGRRKAWTAGPRAAYERMPENQNEHESAAIKK